MCEIGSQFFVDRGEVLAVAAPGGKEFDEGGLRRREDDLVKVRRDKVEHGGAGRGGGGSGGQGEEREKGKEGEIWELHGDRFDCLLVLQSSVEVFKEGDAGGRWF